MKIKYYYNKYYIPIFLKKEDYAFSRLYKNYNIFINVIIIRKLKQQYVNLFKILRKID